jgi:Fe2+ or Zn2+ uptake regulation protein
MNKEEIIKEVITILETSDYVDTAEDLYDGLKQIKREITYATVHDFLWALESSTVIDVDGKVAECANKIKPLLDDMTIDEAYKNYTNKLIFNEEDCHVDDLINKPNRTFVPFSQEEFIDKCKTDTEFSEKWGLKIEERELSLEERAQWLQDNKGYDLLVGNLDHDHIREVVEEEAPTKLITITYNDKTIESYE